jgi:hypothetical protein
MDHGTDEGPGGGCRLGLIVLSTDEPLQDEARQVLARCAPGGSFNQALLWHLLSLGGLEAQGRGQGRLFAGRNKGVLA